MMLYKVHKESFYGFGMAWGWVTDDFMFIFGWTVSLRENYGSHHSRLSYDFAPEIPSLSY